VDLGKYYDVWVDDLTTQELQVLRNPETTGTSWVPTMPMTPGHRYRWWVASVSGDGTTMWSRSADFDIPKFAAPAVLAPTGMIPTDVPTFTWRPVDHAGHYDVWVNDLTTGQAQVLRHTTATGDSWAPATALTPGHRYRWWVGAVSPGGAMMWSTSSDFDVPALDAPRPSAPRGITASDIPVFTWTGVSLATRYDIWVNDQTTGTTQVLRNTAVTGTSWSPAVALVRGHAYRWWVRALSANDTASAWSNALDFTLA
jgi:hypothetical protein